jgi:hypothetical protein
VLFGGLFHPEGFGDGLLHQSLIMQQHQGQHIHHLPVIGTGIAQLEQVTV